ncbi:MAG: phosphorylase [Bacteroidia bacterium]|nr:MAG: phosphorylase [Bacteroidia bacterium]
MKDLQLTRTIPTSELMLHTDGSIMHLRLKPGEVASTIILVGDPGRVALVAKHFTRVVKERKNREFHSLLGDYQGHPITVLSTGIGAGSIDIVMTEIDALWNIDLHERQAKPEHTPLRFIRIGTSGAIQEDIANGDPVVSDYTVGLDGLAYWYSELQHCTDSELNRHLHDYLPVPDGAPMPYAVRSAPGLVSRLQTLGHHGMTLSMPGFYGPQARQLRLTPALTKLVQRANQFRHGDLRILNMEMESGAVNAMATMLGHEAITVSMAIDNRMANTATTKLKGRMDELIAETLHLAFV